MRSWPKLRWVLTSVVAVALLAASGGICWRVLAPAETLNPAQRAYPFREAVPSVRLAALTAAPLIVDGRLRVYAEKRRVWADTPVSAETALSPYWAYRRWPAQLVGVVAVESPGSTDPIVVTRWSDGVVVALNARTGRIAWRLTGPQPSVDRYTGRRTGASVIYEPAGLYTASSAADGRPVLVITGNTQVSGYDPMTGAQRWTVPRLRCGSEWTGQTTVVAVTGPDGSCSGLDVFDAGTGLLLRSWQSPGPIARGPADAMTPWDCTLGHSSCGMIAVRVGATASYWALGADGVVRPEKYARSTDDLVLGDGLLHYGESGNVAMIDRVTGAQRWSTQVSGRLVAADTRHGYLISKRADLVVLNLANGHLAGRVDLRGKEGIKWLPGHVYLHDGFLAVERITGTPRDSDDQYFLNTTPVVLAGV